MRSFQWHHLSLFLLLSFLFSCSSHKNRSEQVAPEKSGSLRLVKILEPYAGIKIFQYRHPASQLDFFLLPQGKSGATAYITAYNVGARYEIEGRTGLAHLFEHMMFRGTKSFPEPFKTLSNWGDQFNAFTSQDETVYHQLTSTELLPEVAKFEAERMRALQITPEAFNTERHAVISERKMRYEDNPRGRIYWEMYQLAFDKHPYRTTPIGWQEDLDATSFEDALAFYKRFYAPNRAKIAIVGDFEIERAVDALNKSYSSFKAEEWIEPQVSAEPLRSGLRRKVLALKSESVLMSDAVLGLKYDDPNAPAEALYCTLLADGKIGFLAMELVEKGIAQSVGADCAPNVDPALSTISLVANPGVSAIRLENAYLKALKNFPRWLTQERIEKIKLLYSASQLASLRDPTHLAIQIASGASVKGDPLYDFKFLEKIKALNRQDISAWMAKRTRNPTRLIIVPGPKNPPMTKPATKG